MHSIIPVVHLALARRRFRRSSNDEEYGFPSYRDYLDKLETKLSPAVVEAMRQDQFSPFNDPAGDNYHFYRGHDYDDAQTSILDRYKRYNGTENNSGLPRK